MCIYFPISEKEPMSLSQKSICVLHDFVLHKPRLLCIIYTTHFIYLFTDLLIYLFIYLFIYFGLFVFSRAAPTAYGGSQARGPIGAVTAGWSHSSAGSEPHLRPTAQVTATPDPLLTIEPRQELLHHSL